MSGLISLLANAATHNKHGLCISVAVTGLYFFFYGVFWEKKKKKTTEKEENHPQNLLLGQALSSHEAQRCALLLCEG